MKKIYIVLLLIVLTLTSCTADQQSENTKLNIKNIEVTDTQNEVAVISGIPNPDLPESWLGSYEQNGIREDEIKVEFNLYIYQENELYYGYLSVRASETGTSCYLNERILTEVRGSHDMLEVYFLEKRKLIQGCNHEEYPEFFSTECGESKLDQAVSTYENQDLLFTLIREEDTYSVIEANMILGKTQDGGVNDFVESSSLTIDNICEDDEEIFLKMFREKEKLSENQLPDYSCYLNNGELILNLYLNKEQEFGTGIYYGETQISRFITQFGTDQWQRGVWEDNKYSLMRAGEKAETALEEYQEYTEYNDQSQLSSFYSEGIITGWGDPQKEVLVWIEFFYRADGTLERKECQYNHRLYGTTRQSETFYFDAEERLTYSTSYATFGMLSDYYFYEDGKKEPAFYLTLEHRGWGCYGELVKYDNAYTGKASS